MPPISQFKTMETEYLDNMKTTIITTRNATKTYNFYVFEN